VNIQHNVEVAEEEADHSPPIKEVWQWSHRSRHPFSGVHLVNPITPRSYQSLYFVDILSIKEKLMVNRVGAMNIYCD